MAEPIAAPRHFVLVPAGGTGSRLGGARPKQYLELDGRTVLEHAVAPFLQSDRFTAIVVVVAPGDAVAAGFTGLHARRLQVVDIGGATRRETVRAGLRWLADREDARAGDWVYVHDAARPGLDPTLLERLCAALDDEPVGALLAVPVVDTVKRGTAGRIDQTVLRDGLWLAQTPQVFRHGALAGALDRYPDATDEASAIEASGARPALIEGSRRNFKITTVEDLAMMRVLMSAQASR